MSTFFIKHRLSQKKPSRFIAFPEQGTKTPVDERPFWEVQRAEALEILVNLYNHWQNSWLETKSLLKDVVLSPSSKARINFYETEQQKAILSLLAKILVAWEKSEETSFSENIISLAKELRPSYAYLEADPEEDFSLSDSQLASLRSFIASEATVLKDSVRELQLLSWHKIDFKDNIISEKAAEALLKEALGLVYFDFVDSTDDPSFTPGYYPALLQEITDQGF